MSLSYFAHHVDYSCLNVSVNKLNKKGLNSQNFYKNQINIKEIWLQRSETKFTKQNRKSKRNQTIKINQSPLSNLYLTSL